MTACAPLLQRYAWPGNVRELRNLTERLALFLAAEPLQALTPAFVLSVAPELAPRSATQPHADARRPAPAYDNAPVERAAATRRGRSGNSIVTEPGGSTHTSFVAGVSIAASACGSIGS